MHDIKKDKQEIIKIAGNCTYRFPAFTLPAHCCMMKEKRTRKRGRKWIFIRIYAALSGMSRY